MNTEERKSALKKLKALINGHWNGKKIIIHEELAKEKRKYEQLLAESGGEISNDL